MRNGIFYIILSFYAALTGCSTTTEIEYPLDYEGNRLVLFSHLELDGPIMIQVSRTSHPLDTFHQDSFFVHHAQIIMFENDVPFTFHYTGSGIYATDEDIKVKAGSAYRFEVNANGYPGAYSDTEIIPPPGIIKNLQWMEAELPSQYEGILSFEIDVPEGNPFMFELEGISGSNRLYANYNILTGLGQYCENLVLVPECLTSGGKIEMEVDTDFRFGQTNISFTHLIVNVSVISPALKNYMESVSLQFDAFDFPFLPNVSPYTNIHNGYGLISSGNRVSATIEIN